MKMMSIGLGLLIACCVNAAALAQGAPFPSRPVRIVVPFPPGGGTDVAARALADYLQRDLGQPVVVDNRPGGNSVIASELVARAAPDGYTLLLTTDFHSINAAFGSKLPYDTLRDFAPVARISTSPLMLVANPSTGVKNVAELVAAAKASPGKLTFASLGKSSPHYLGFEWFKHLAGIDILDVPYKGGGPALADVLGGQVDLTLVVAANGIAHAHTGKVVAIAVTGPTRAAIAGDVPTFAEAGFPQFVMLNWYGVFAPAGTPHDVIDKLNGSIVKALRTPAVTARIAAVGVDPAPGTPAELDAWLRADIARYRRIIELTGAEPELR